MNSTELVATFTVARNPDPASKLGYLVRLPLAEATLVLKAADRWAHTANHLLWHAATGRRVDLPLSRCRSRPGP